MTGQEIETVFINLLVSDVAKHDINPGTLAIGLCVFVTSASDRLNR